MTHNNKTRRTGKRKRPMGGFAMIEALVGMLIFSAGILGMVGLQAAMTRAQGVAKYRADATILASELLGSMWGDAQANYVNYVSSKTVACTHTPCARWLANVAEKLPQGAATIAIDAATGVTTVSISWTLPTDGTHTYVTSTVVTR